MPDELDWHPFHIPSERPIWLLVTEQEKRKYLESSVFHCKHEKAEYRIRTIKGGGRQLIRQCRKCGSAFGSAAKIDQNASAHNWDVTLSDRAHVEMEEVRKRIYEIALDRTADLETEGYADYEEYLASSKWARKRTAILERDQKLCQACLNSQATEVHHLTYERIFDEPMFDLVAICRPCHERLHKKQIAAIAAAKAKSSEIPDPPG